MFDDPRKELEELQEKLLQDEDWFEQELDSVKRMIGQKPEKDRVAAAKKKEEAGKAPVRDLAKDDTQVWTRELNLEEEKNQVKEKSNKNLVILAVLETLGILAIGAYWLLFLL